MKNTFPFLFLLVILFSCKKSQQTSDGINKIDLSSVLENPKKQEIFSGVRHLKLESNPDALLGSSLFFEIRDDKIYILDRFDQYAVLVFDDKGNFINKVGKHGRGPEEYLQPLDFIVRNDTIDFLDFVGDGSTIFSYSSSGDFINKRPLEYQAFSFSRVCDYYTISTNYNKNVHDHQVYLLNNEGQEVQKYLPNNTSIDNPLVIDCFSKNKDEVLYFEPFNNQVYVFDDLELKPVIEFDFGKYNIPESFYREDMESGLRMLNQQGFTMIRSIVANKKYIAFEITLQQVGNSLKMFDVFYNRETKQIKYMLLGDDDQIFRYPMGLNENDEIMYLVFPLGDVNKKAKQFGLDLNIENFDEVDNPAIMYCKIDF